MPREFALTGSGHDLESGRSVGRGSAADTVSRCALPVR
jgi:hypothetical protein